MSWTQQVGTPFFIKSDEAGRWLFRVRTNNKGHWYVQRHVIAGWRAADATSWATAEQAMALVDEGLIS